MIILTDDQGQEMSCMGTPGISTPHMDALAARGMLFRKVYNTYASCTPARASLMTGTYPHTHRLTINVPEFFGPVPTDLWRKTNDWRNKGLAVPASIATLPELFNQAGYRTCITHKLHMQPQEKFPFNDWIMPAPDDPVLGSEAYATMDAREPLTTFFAQVGDKPFFLYHNIGAPHRSFENHLRDKRTKPVDPAKVVIPAYLPDVPAVRQDWADYLTSVQEADAQVGDALEVLEKSGKLDNTIIILVGDNGPAFIRGKASTYPLGAREAMVIAGPGLAKNVQTDELVSFVDIAPTLLEIAGIEIPASVQGKSILPLLEQRKGAKGQPLLICEKYGRNAGPKEYRDRAAFDGRYHYIRRMNASAPRSINADNFELKPWGNRTYPATLENKDKFPEAYALMLAWREGTDPEELFDLQNDPWGTRNIAKDPAHATALAQMRKAMDEWQDQTGDSEMIRSRDIKNLP